MLRNRLFFAPIFSFFLAFCMFIFFGCANIDNSDDRFTQLLSLLPSSAADSGGFILIDYEKCFQDIEISRFTQNGSPYSIEEFNKLLLEKINKVASGKLEFIGMGNYYTGFSDFASKTAISFNNVGYDYAFVNTEIQSIYQSNLTDNFKSIVSAFPDDWSFSKEQYVAAIGRYNSQSTESALSNRDSWPDWVKNGYINEKYHGTIINSWNEGDIKHSKNRFSPPNLDWFGRALPMAVDDGSLFVAGTIDQVKAMIDTKQKRTKSLAEIPEYALIAKKMTELNASMMIIVDQSLVNGYPEDFDRDTGPLLKKFLTCGMSYGSDTKGDYVTLVIANKGENDAAQNAQLLSRRIPIASMHELGMTSFTEDNSIKKLINDSEITVEGRLTILKLYTDDISLWHELFSLRSNLLLHEK
jgi:hypothetical protein